MMHWKTGYYAYMFCKKCHRKTKHLHWQDEVTYSRGGNIFFPVAHGVKLSNGYECTVCHNHFNYDGRVKLWKAFKRRK